MAVPVCLNDFEQMALVRMDPNALVYYRSGANSEETLRDNRHAFSRLLLRPRCLRDVSKRDLSTTVLGHRISFPVGIAPTAMQRMAHPDGEVATARAASAVGTVMILSTLSTTSLEEVAEKAPGGLRFFQLYVFRDRALAKHMMQRAAQNGYKALVLTVDAPVFGLRLNDIRNRFTLPPHLRYANFESSDKTYRDEHSPKGGSILNEYVTRQMDPSLTWQDFKWLQSISPLPIIVKGILTPEDAELAVQHGVAGIVVSNHGGRQLDSVSSTIDALPAIVKAVNGRCEVYLDGGVRTGTDVVKALALGARAVFVGRPVLWGLNHDGETGVKKMLDILQREVDVAMALSGCTLVDDIKPELVMPRHLASNI